MRRVETGDERVLTGLSEFLSRSDDGEYKGMAITTREEMEPRETDFRTE